MTERSFISPGVQKNLERVGIRAFQTRLQLQDGGAFIVWGRWNDELQDHTVVGEGYVIFTYANQQVSRQSSPSASSTQYDGSIEHLAPWDLEVGDSFTVKVGGDTLTGSVKQIFPTKLGVVKATFQLAGGDRA